MPKLSNVSSGIHPHKVLIAAPSGTGKTALIGTLANAGYRCFVLDFENGFEILLDPLVVKPAYRDNIIVKSFEDEPLPKFPQAFQSALKALDNWTEVEPGSDGKPITKSYGGLKDWGPRDVVVVDTLGRAATAALESVRFINGHFERASLPDIGTAMDMIEAFLDKLCATTVPCHVVVLAHITFVGAPEQLGVTKGFPLALGNKLPPKIPRFFNSMLGLERRINPDKSQGFWLMTRATSMLDLKTPAPSVVPAEMPADLANYFRLLDSVQIAKSAPVTAPATPKPVG